MLAAREGRAVRIRRGVLLSALSAALSLVLPTLSQAQIHPIELEGFIVTGTPVPRALGTEGAFVTVLEGEDLLARGVVRVADALAQVPGLVVVQGGSYGTVTSTFFRGAESDHVKVLVDGVEVNQAGGAFDFSGLLTTDVERIEVARGPASALYGSDAMAGVIHILTRRGRGPLQSTLSLAGGSFGRLESTVDLRGGGNGTSYSLAASRLSSDGILEFNNRFESTSLSGAAFLTPDDRTRVALVGRYGDRVYHFPTDGSGNVVDRNAYSYGDEVALSVEANRRVADRISLAAMIRSYSWDGGSDDQSDGPDDTAGYYGYVSHDALQRVAVDLRGNVDLPGGVVLSLGAEGEDVEQRSFSESLSEYGPSPSRSRNQRSNRGYYAHMAAQRGPWAGNLGARVEDNEQYGDFITWQAGLSHSLDASGTRFRGNVGKGMKEPTFAETTTSAFTVGNPDLAPEQSLVWEVGVEQRVGRGGGQISLTWFDQSLQDLIQYTFAPPSPGDPNYFNVAEARSRGLEAAARVPMGRAAFTGGYTYLDTEVVDAGFDDGPGATFVEGEALIRRPRHQMSLSGSYGFHRGTVSADLRWVGSRADRDFSAWPAAPVKLESYARVGLGGEVRIREATSGGPGLTLTARVENLFDETYQEVLGFRAPGRALVVGGRVDLGG